MANLLKQVRLKRPNTYAVLDALIRKGLATKKRCRKKAVFEAQPPSRLTALAAERFAVLQNAKLALEKALPELNALYTASTERPVVQFFSGLIGLEKVYDDILKSRPAEVLVFASLFSRKVPGFGALVDRQVRRQMKAGIKARALRGSTGDIETDKQHIIQDEKLDIQRRLLPAATFRLPGQIVIYQNKVAITTFKTDLTTTWLENTDVAQTLRLIFEKLWTFSEAGFRQYYKKIMGRPFDR